MRAGQTQALKPPAGVKDWPPLFHPAVVLFGLLTFDWIIVAEPGGFSVRLPYLGVLLAVVAGGLSARVIFAGAGLVSRWAPLIVPYAFYVMILFLVLNATEARGMAFRQIIFFSSFLVIAAWIAAARDIRRVVRWSGAACLVAFAIGTELVARSVGSGWLEAIGRFFLKGDLNFVIYDFFRAIFNAYADADEFVKASQKNSVAVAILIALWVFRAGGATQRRDTPGMIVTAVSFLVLLMLNSRSVLLAMVLGFGLVGLLHALRDWRPSITGAIGMIFVFLFASAGLTALFYSDNAAIAALGERFAFADDSAASRVDQYTWAIQRIEGNILLGSGYGELDGQPVHNLFLGALMHAGLAAFFLVAVAYASLLYFWTGFMYRIVMAPSWWVLPIRAEWVAVLPVLPILRVWLSGDAGHPGFAEWMALAMFFGLLQANTLRRGAMAVR